MRKIQLKDAKATLSSVVNDAVRGQAAGHYSSRQAGGGRAWYRGMGALVARSLVWPPSYVGAD